MMSIRVYYIWFEAVDGGFVLEELLLVFLVTIATRSDIESLLEQQFIDFKLPTPEKRRSSYIFVN